LFAILLQTLAIVWVALQGQAVYQTQLWLLYSTFIPEQVLETLQQKVLGQSSSLDDATARTLLHLAEKAALHSKHAFPCSDTHKALPSHPSLWPQAPLMVRPTPKTTTKIRGIRRAKSLQYEDFSGFCAGCILPINNGKEEPGESLVVDFESTHFVGTMLMRTQQAKAVVVPGFQEEQEANNMEEKKSYFDGKKRKFQAVSNTLAH
jgi:hypothetical protein